MIIQFITQSIGRIIDSTTK